MENQTDDTPELKVLVQVLETVVAALGMERPGFVQALPIHTCGRCPLQFFAKTFIMNVGHVRLFEAFGTWFLCS